MVRSKGVHLDANATPSIARTLQCNYNSRMDLRFVWDSRKATSNAGKHGVTFEEAQTVFLDDDALLTGDPDHSEDEDRFVLLGLSAKSRALVVCHCYRESDSEIRLISARKATRIEQGQYLERKAR